MVIIYAFPKFLSLFLCTLHHIFIKNCETASFCSLTVFHLIFYFTFSFAAAPASARFFSASRAISSTVLTLRRAAPS